VDGTSVGATNVVSASLSTDDLTTGEVVDARLWYVDADTGHVWQRLTQEGDDPAPDAWQDVGLMVPPGGGGGGVGDGLDPPTVTGFVCDSVYQQQSDGTSLPVIACTWDPVVAPDLIGYELEWQAGVDPPPDPDNPGTDPPYVPPDWLNPLRTRVGSDQTNAVLQPVIGGRIYDVRIRGYDAESRVGVWATDAQTPIGRDAEAPPWVDPSAYPGYRLMGVRWDPVAAVDLAYYEARYRRMAWAGGVGHPAQGVSEFVTEQTRSTLIVFNDLGLAPETGTDGSPLPPYEYEAQVRSVDSSNNTRAVETDPSSAVDVALPANVDAGYSPLTPGVAPLRVGESDIAFQNVIISEILDANHINAKYIVTGALSVGGVDSPVAIRVYDDTGHAIGAWGSFGWVVADQSNSNSAIWVNPAGEMRFTEDFVWDGTEDLWVLGDPGLPSEQHIGTVRVGIEQGIIDTPASAWTTAIDARGINASAITFGTIGGGSNRALNAGFELITPATSSVSAKEWTLTTDWDDVLGGSINLSVSTGDLKMTAV
jgi:hypothetical protein